MTDSNNIILFGGLNGAGKTTFADSIRLCLYGRAIFGKVLSESKYQEFLLDFCTNTLDINEAYVSMSVVLDEENPPVELDIRRSFKKTKSGFKEELTLNKSGSSVELIDENYWSYYIEKLIPPNVSRYFFFDGEKVKEIMASEDSISYLFNAVKDLSGVSELDNLRKDLLEVRKNILSKTKKKSDLEQIESLRKMIEYHSDQVESLKVELQNRKNQIVKYEQDKTDINSDMTRIIGVNDSKKKTLYDSLKKLSIVLSELEENVVDFCYNRMMYMVSADSLKRTIERAKNENQELICNYSVEALKSIISNGESEKIIGMGPKSSQIIERIIDSLSTKKGDSSEQIIDISLSRIAQMESLYVTDDEIENFQKNYELRESTEHQIKSIQKKIEKIDEGVLSEYESDLDAIDTKIQECNVSVIALESEMNSNSQKIDDLLKKLKDAERSIVLEKVDRVAVDTIGEILASISERISIITEGSKRELIKNVNGMYSLLKNDEDMVKEIQIDGDYRLHIRNFANQELNISGLSEGEKSILMYSVVFALHKLSKLHFPMIIDSPIGRMDSIHSDNLASKLYPVVSNQLILLSHNREIVGSLHDKLRKCIASEYIITKYGEPKITPGYFD